MDRGLKSGPRYFALLWRRDGDRQDAHSLDTARSPRHHAARRARHLIMSDQFHAPLFGSSVT